MNLVFFDTETTGNETEDRLIQLAYVSGDLVFNSLFKPPIPIKIDAMAVHHITEKMVQSRTSFQESEQYVTIKALFESPDTIAVAHNVEFDQAMLSKEGIEIANPVCTLKLARHFDPEGKIPKHSLQYLRYFLGIEVEGEAHDALGDVMVLRALFERLKAKFPENSYEEMLAISTRPSLIARFAFGKHKGKLISEVPHDYLEWLKRSETEKGDMADKNMLYTIDCHLSK